MSMIEFNELRITPDNKCLIIDVSVSQDSYYKDVYLDSIIIDNQDSYAPNGPSDNPVCPPIDLTKEYKEVFSRSDIETYIIPSDQKGTTDGTIKKKRVRLTLTKQDIGNIDNSMFFVYVIVNGIPSPDTPCGMDNSVCMRTVIDLQTLYNKAIQYFKQINDTCAIPKEFIDMVLRIKALELSIKTGNYTQAISYWNKYFINLQNKVELKTTNCGCSN